MFIDYTTLVISMLIYSQLSLAIMIAFLWSDIKDYMEDMEF